jgi:hypothetical protein
VTAVGKEFVATLSTDMRGPVERRKARTRSQAFAAAREAAALWYKSSRQRLVGAHRSWRSRGDFDRLSNVFLELNFRHRSGLARAIGEMFPRQPVRSRRELRALRHVIGGIGYDTSHMHRSARSVIWRGPAAPLFDRWGSL